MSVHRKKKGFYFHPSWRIFREFIKGEIGLEEEKKFVRHLVTCRSCLEERLPEALSNWCYEVSHRYGKTVRVVQTLEYQHLADEQIMGFIDNTLSPKERTRVVMHMGICNQCFGDLIEVWQEEILSKEEKLVFKITEKRMAGIL